MEADVIEISDIIKTSANKIRGNYAVTQI